MSESMPYLHEEKDMLHSAQSQEQDDMERKVVLVPICAYPHQLHHKPCGCHMDSTGDWPLAVWYQANKVCRHKLQFRLLWNS